MRAKVSCETSLAVGALNMRGWERIVSCFQIRKTNKLRTTTKKKTSQSIPSSVFELSKPFVLATLAGG